MRGFETSGLAQRLLSTFGVISSFFKPGRQLLTAKKYREIMRRRFTGWFVVVHSPIAPRKLYKTLNKSGTSNSSRKSEEGAVGIRGI